MSNVDGLVILTALFEAARGGARRWQTVLDQHVGFVAVLGLSPLAATGLVLASRPWIGQVGAPPPALGA